MSSEWALSRRMHTQVIDFDLRLPPRSYAAVFCLAGPIRHRRLIDRSKLKFMNMLVESVLVHVVLGQVKPRFIRLVSFVSLYICDWGI
jgi:hypothetical protein